MTTESDGTDGISGAGDLRPAWLIERDGTGSIRYAGLLALAHARGLKRITTTLVQAPAAVNGRVAIVAAEVETAQGVFTGLGEAAPGAGHCPPAPALPRLAETRAKAQALADAVNVALPLFEARPDDDPSEAAAGAGPEPVRTATGPEHADQAPQTDRASRPPERQEPADQVRLGAQPYSREQIVAALRRRVRQTRAAGLPVPEPVPAEDGPLSDLVGYVQALRRRLEEHLPGRGGSRPAAEVKRARALPDE